MQRDPQCTRCKLSSDVQAERDVCVWGTGPRDAVLAVVSKFPLGPRSRDELAVYLREAGIDPDRVYHTSALRCRTWGSTSGKTEIKACAPYLASELAGLADLRYVVAVGNEALLATTGRSGILKYRAQQLPLVGGGEDAPVVVPTISPAMVKRNPGQHAGLVADLAYVHRLCTGQEALYAPPGGIRHVYTKPGLQALAGALQAAHGVSLDIETNGFDEYTPDSLIVSVAFTLWHEGDDAPSQVWTVPLAHPESPWLATWRKVVRWLWQSLRQVPHVVAHNGKFDARWLHEFGAPVSLTFDTMLAAHVLDENRPKGLKPLAQSLLGVTPWAMDTRALSDQPLKKVLRYNALDTWWTAHLYFYFRKQLREQPRLARLVKLLLVPASNAFVGIERRGIWTDVPLMNSRAVQAAAELKAIDDELLGLVPPAAVWPEGIKEPNFNASNFARWLLFEHLGLPVLQRGKDKDDGSPGSPSMAESVMQTLQRDHPHRIIDLMLARTKWQKYSSAFFIAYQEQVDHNDRIHTNFKLTGTVTGRLSSGKGDADKVTGRVQNRGVNLQQVPRDQFVRGIFGAPPGWVFVECDYSQVELRVAAHLAQEPTMLHLYNTGQDIHTTMAMRMTGKPASEVTKEERKKAKAVNFGFLYGMGKLKFIDTAWSNYGVVVNEQEAQAFRDAFFSQFPELLVWHQRQRRLVAKYHRVESPLGRVRHLPDIVSADRQVHNEAARQAINSPVQAFASDLTLLSLVHLDRTFKRRGYQARSVGTVHDAINFEMPATEAAEVVPLIRHTMENLPLEKLFGVHLTVPIVADAKMGTRWGDALEVPAEVSSSPQGLGQWLAEHFPGDASLAGQAG